jgi:HEAT repeat protein
VPSANELTGAYRLHLAIALYQLGESDYGPLLDDAIRTGRPTDRMEAATFLGETRDFTNVPRLIAMLSDRTSWSGRVVADVALDALRRLTFQDLAADSAVWLEWYSALRGRSRGAIVEQWVADKRKLMASAPIWEANASIARAGAIRDQSVLPMIHDYLRRKDLDSHATGMGRGSGAGGVGPRGMYGPAVVTLLLHMAQAGVPGAVPGLTACVDAGDPSVRMFGALALAAYEPQLAADRLARELNAPEAARRKQAGELLLELGDARGLPSRLETMERGAAMFGDSMSREHEYSRVLRMSACRDLRVFSQQPLPCDPKATGESLTQQAAAWHAWWRSRPSGSPLAVRQARLDLENQYDIRPVTIGAFVAR